MTQYVLDEKQRVWRDAGDGWWRCIEQGCLYPPMLHLELTALHGPLTRLIPEAAPEPRSYAPKPPPPHRRMDR